MIRRCEDCAFFHCIRTPEEPTDAKHYICEKKPRAISIVKDDDDECIIEFDCHESFIPCKRFIKSKGEISPDEWVYRYMVTNRIVRKKASKNMKFKLKETK